MILATIIFTLFNMMIPELYKSIRDMIMNVPSQMNRFIRELSEMNTENSTIGNIVESVMKEATTFVQNWMRTDLLGRINDFMSGLTVGVLNFMREIMNILIGLIVSVYVLFSKEKFSKQSKKITYAIFKPSNANMILHLTIKSNEIFGGFIIGKIILKRYAIMFTRPLKMSTIHRRCDKCNSVFRTLYRGNPKRDSYFACRA